MAKRKGGMFRPARSNKQRGQGVAGAGGFSPEMMRRAQELQTQLAEAQDELKDATVEASVGGGVVSVTLGGDHKLREVVIDPDVVDPDDTEMLQDLLLAAVNEAQDRLEAMQQERMSGLTDGLSLPGLQ